MHQVKFAISRPCLQIRRFPGQKTQTCLCWTQKVRMKTRKKRRRVATKEAKWMMEEEEVKM